MSERRGNVTGLKMSARRAEQLIREAAKDSSVVVNTLAFREDELWTEVVTSRQILLCLAEGKVIGKPSLDQQGSWVFRVHRLCAGQDVVVTIAIANGDGGVHKVYVIAVENTL